MVWLRGLGAVLLALAGVVLVAPGPASACSCVTGDARQYVEWADVVVVGAVLDRDPPPPREVMSSGDPATYTVEVARVLKGSAAPTSDVLSAVSGASCGLEGIELGSDYVVFATEKGDALWASLCGGTQRATPRFVADVEQVTGPGEPAQAVAPVVPRRVERVANLGGDDPAARALVPWWVWAGGVGLAVGLGVAVVVVAGGRRA